MLRQPRSGYLFIEPKKGSANFCFANRVRGVRRTATKLCSVSRKLRLTCSGNIRPVWRTLFLIESCPVDEEERKRKMDDDVHTLLALEGIDLVVDLWEAQPCLWDQNDMVFS